MINDKEYIESILDKLIEANNMLGYEDDNICCIATTADIQLYRCLEHIAFILGLNVRYIPYDGECGFMTMIYKDVKFSEVWRYSE